MDGRREGECNSFDNSIITNFKEHLVALKLLRLELVLVKEILWC